MNTRTDGSQALPPEASSISSTLLERVKAEQPEAWTRLVTLYGPVVYRWRRQAGVTRDDAPDVVQEVFTAVARHVASRPDCRASLATFDGVEDTLLNQLRRPAVADPFLEECQVAVARACTVQDAFGVGRAKRSLCGKTLGEYQLISELGQGGMGTAYSQS